MSEVLCSVKDVASMLNVSERRVQQLVKEGILPGSVNYRYDLVACGKAYIEHVESRQTLANQSKDKLDSELKSEKVLHERAVRKKQEYLLKELERSMYRAEDVERVWNDQAMAFRARVMALPSRIAPLVQYETDVEGILVICKKEVDSALIEMSNYDPAKFTKRVNYDDNEDDEPDDE